ncbi:hypothetical protein B0H14DRAFT_2605887 [Mycena olivaceomarginata]|nr:hypothetical protein B0H14DRAFT_2605887 [Mycena olivaceomarginata]
MPVKRGLWMPIVVLKENWARAVGRGDRERALDGRQSKLAFGNLRPAIASNSEEAEFFQTISHTRGGPNYHAHTKKALKTANFAGYSTSEGINKPTNIWPDAREAPVGAVIPKSRDSRNSSNFTHLTVSSRFQRLVEARGVLKIEGTYSRRKSSKEEKKMTLRKGCSMRRRSSAHRTGVKRGTAGNECTRGRDRARERRATSARAAAIGAYEAGIKCQGGGGAAEIEHRTAGNIERVWSGYRGHRRGRRRRVTSARAAGKSAHGRRATGAHEQWTMGTHERWATNVHGRGSSTGAAATSEPSSAQWGSE